MCSSLQINTGNLLTLFLLFPKSHLAGETVKGSGKNLESPDHCDRWMEMLISSLDNDACRFQM